MVTPESDPADVHWVYLSDWWPVAKAVTDAGYDCTVLDPDASADETFFDGHELHGVINVRAHAGLGWIILISQTETEDLGGEG